jgi:hypothetical protein
MHPGVYIEYRGAEAPADSAWHRALAASAAWSAPGLRPSCRATAGSNTCTKVNSVRKDQGTLKLPTACTRYLTEEQQQQTLGLSRFDETEMAQCV